MWLKNQHKRHKPTHLTEAEGPASSIDHTLSKIQKKLLTARLLTKNQSVWREKKTTKKTTHSLK